MKRWLKRLGWFVLGLVVLLSIITVDQLRHGGQFRELTVKPLPECTALPLEASAEDIQVDRARGIAYLSFLDRRGLVEGKRVLGTVMLVDLNATEPRARPALLSDPKDFRPHGMSLYRAGDGSMRLFVISHPPEQGHEVHVFEQTATGAFALVTTLRDPLLLRPNAIAATGQSQFYIANDSGAINGWQRFQEFIFRRGLAELVYYDGSKFRVVDRGLKSASGIAASPDGSKLYVSETNGKRLRVYDRNPSSGDVTLAESIELPSAPDNANVNSDGTVWIAAHAKTLALVQSFADAKNLAPTEVLRFDPRREGADRLQSVYVNMGEQISAGAGATVYENSVLIGSITDRKMLRCRLP